MRVIATATALLLPVLIPGALAGQACLGMPSSDGQIAVAGAAAFTDGELEAGGDFHVDVTGPASFRVSYGNGHDDGIGRTYGALGGYELYLLDPSICGVAGAFYTTDPAAGVDTHLGLTAGFGIGKTLRASRLTTTVYAIPRYVRLHETVTVLGGAEDVTASNEFMAEAGVTVGLAPFFAGGDLILSTVGDAEPAFRIRIGLLF